MRPHPWHLKHWRECGSWWLAVTSPLTLGLQLPWSPPQLPMASASWSVGWLQAGFTRPGLSMPLWEFRWLGVLLPLCPDPWLHSQGLPGSLEGLLPCLVWLRMAINLAICWLSSAVPSPMSIVTVTLALTFPKSLHSHFLPYGWQPSDANWRYQGYCTSSRWNHGCICRLHGRGNPWGTVVPPGLSSSQGTKAGFDLGSLPSSWQRRGPSHCYPGWLYRSSAWECQRKPLCQKITETFHKIWSTLVVGPTYLAISATAPFNNWMILSLTTASG